MTRNSCRYLALPLIGMVAACGGNDPGPVTASNCGVVSGSCTAPVPPTPTPVPAPTPLFQVNELTTYNGVGGTQQLTETFRKIENSDPVDHSRSELYTAEQSKPDTQQVQVSYNPRDAVFTFKIEHEGSDADLRFQDPLHRTDFQPSNRPQASTPNLPLFNYLESGESSADSFDARTFFYRGPGDSSGNRTRFVTLAGFTRNKRDGKLDSDFTIQRVRGAYAFGSQTPASAIPTRGTGKFTGDMLATMVRNEELEVTPGTRSRFEWISGTATVDVDFRAGSLTTNFSGEVRPEADAFSGEPFGPYNAASTGTSFTASGTASFDASRQNYAGTIGSARLGASEIRMAASSLDGSFYGPDATETGGAFRIIGSIPDQRVDIIGGFVGIRPPQ